MRPILSILVLLLPALGQTTPKPSDLATVEGTVRHSITGQLLSKAVLTLQGSGNAATTTSDANGKFAMKNLAPGQYSWGAQRTGFTNFVANGFDPNSFLTLEKGQAKKGVEIKLTPQSAIAGRITDDDNEPVLDASITLLKPRYVLGKRELVHVATARSNDLGEYRIHALAAGVYYLSVGPPRENSFGNRVDHSAGEPASAYTAVYYPVASELSAAQKIKVPPATTVSGIDVRMRKEQAFRVKGHVSGFAEGSNGATFVSVIGQNAGNDQSAPGIWVNFTTGAFETPTLRPGSYALRVVQQDLQQRSGLATVTITDRLVEDINIVLRPSVEVSGSIRTASEKFGIITSGVELFSRYGGGYRAGKAKEDGAFTITAVTCNHYDLRVIEPPQGFYVKSARTPDTDVMENGLDLSAGIPVNNLEIVLSPEAAQLDGSVIDEKGNAVQGATVVLRPKNGRPSDLAWMHPAVTTVDGKFTIHSIAPGEYEILAFANVEQADALNPDLFKDYELQAESLRLGSNSKETRQLKAITVSTQ